MGRGVVALDHGMSLPKFSEMTENELTNFWRKYHRASRTEAAELVGPRWNRVDVAATLAAYALDVACVKKLRREGHDDRAEIYERSAKIRLDTLPSDLGLTP